MKAIDWYYEQQAEPNKSCLLSLRHFILSFDPNFTETLKWSIPCFSYDGKISCFLNINRKTKHPYILFSHGSLLKNKALKSEGRKLMKSLAVRADKDLNIDLLNEIYSELIILLKK